MIKFYSSHCPKCIILENLMKQKGIEYETITDENIYLKVADEHNIMSMPFAEINNQIYNTQQLQEYIMGV